MANPNEKTFASGALGLGIGLLVGLLIAPDSGKNTLSEMKGRGNEAMDTANTIAKRARKKWKELKEEAKRDIEAVRQSHNDTYDIISDGGDYPL